ncbi:ribose-5-phosphate isomerase [Pelagirhabdus alkalitolerans]|uniref:Ribose-5-phosphate isomerase n=1 Tax=Pelagirhabdus alkalitolerans TaxID=1612202 RepID=A0A1G6GHN5_9BACI|nr:ribose 5-phosphate isomerase B [Pelagirhabdus alkalitolerans]SDB81460.1 ribose-5-phosphate isomerase [Pelagirhabdus alkalitolerans]
MKVVLASDHGGYELANEIESYLQELGVSVDYIGCNCPDSVDYSDYGIPAAEKVANQEYDRAIVICGTGIGMSISANKVKGIRCALVHDVYTARVTREHNDSNVLAMGARVIGVDLAKEIVKTWMGSEFEGGRHARRIEKIAEYESKE